MNSANLIADIVGHPQGAPSVAELEFMNPSLTDDSIHHHLGKLVEADLVEVLEVPQGQRNKRIPHEFYRLTPNARELFDRNGLFPEAAWRRQYDAVEKTPEIRTIEEIPRPER